MNGQTAPQQLNFGELFQSLITMLIVMAMMKVMMVMVTGKMPKPPTTISLPGGYELKKKPVAPTAEEVFKAPEIAELEVRRLEERRLALEAKAEELIKQSGEDIEFISLERGWEGKYATVTYRFRDKVTGENFIARDVEDVKFKIRILRR